MNHRNDFGTYSQDSYPISSRLEISSNVIFGTALEQVDLDAFVKKNAGSNHSGVMRPVHIVMDDKRWST